MEMCDLTVIATTNLDAWEGMLSDVASKTIVCVLAPKLGPAPGFVGALVAPAGLVCTTLTFVIAPVPSVSIS